MIEKPRRGFLGTSNGRAAMERLLGIVVNSWSGAEAASGARWAAMDRGRVLWGDGSM